MLKNREVPQYYVEEIHPTIIDRETWEAVQLEMQGRKKYCEEHGVTNWIMPVVAMPCAGE